MMKIIDEVIDAVENCYCLTEPIKGCDQCPYYGECNRDGDPYRDDVLYYLKMYRSDKLQWEADKKAYEDERQKAIHATKKARERYIALAKDTKDELAVLRDYWAELQANNPLTWDELNDMIGKPIWIEMEEIGFWYIILNFEEGKGFDDYMMTSPFNQWWKSELGTVWNAYRKERE